MRKRYDIFFLSNLFFLSFVQVLDEEKLESYFIESEKKEKKGSRRRRLLVQEIFSLRVR